MLSNYIKNILEVLTWNKNPVANSDVWLSSRTGKQMMRK